MSILIDFLSPEWQFTPTSLRFVAISQILGFWKKQTYSGCTTTIVDLTWVCEGNDATQNRVAAGLCIIIINNVTFSSFDFLHFLMLCWAGQQARHVSVSKYILDHVVGPFAALLCPGWRLSWHRLEDRTALV